MAQQLVDQLLKKMAEYHADEFIHFVFPEAEFKIISTQLDKELIIKKRKVDAVIKILAREKEHLIHFEFQTDYRSNIAKRIFIYAGALTAKYHLDVTSILFQIKEPPKRVRTINQYNVNLCGTITNSFGFHCIRLWEYYDEIFQGKPEFLSFVPLLLELSKKPDENLLAHQRQLLEQEKNLVRRAELTGMCLALASRHFNFNFLRDFFKEDQAMLEKLEEVPYIGDKIKSARSTGLEEGMKEGVQQTMRSNIIELLTTRFQSLNGIETLINNIDDNNILKKIFQIALTADSVQSLKNSILKLQAK